MRSFSSSSFIRHVISYWKYFNVFQFQTYGDIAHMKSRVYNVLCILLNVMFDKSFKCVLCMVFHSHTMTKITLCCLRMYSQWFNRFEFVNRTHDRSTWIFNGKNLAKLKHLSYRINWPVYTYCRFIKFNLNMVFKWNLISFKKNSIISLDYWLKKQKIENCHA